MKKKSENVVQPNQITMARYDYTLWEKRVMFQIVRNIQGEIHGEQELPRSAMGDVYFELAYKNIDPEGKNYHLVSQALQSLRAKNISIEYGNRFWVGGLINWAEKKGEIITISLPQRIMPFLTEMALGFTAFSATVAMTLKSIYSQRFYEICSRFKNNKTFSLTPQELKHRFMLPDSYNDYSLLRTRVLEKAKTELKQLFDQDASDLFFDYEEVREGRGRGGKVKQLIFNIFLNDRYHQIGSQEKVANRFQAIANFLVVHFGEDHPENRAYCNALLMDLDRETLEELDFDQIIKLIEMAESKKSPAAYFRASMKKNYNLPRNM